MPRIPPASASVAASTRKTVRTWASDAPIAFIRPISDVRSVTETSITFMIPMPATVSEIAAIPTRAIVSVSRIASRADSIEPCETIVKSSSPSCCSRRIRFTSAVAVSASAQELVWIVIRKRPVRLNICIPVATGTMIRSSMSIPIAVPLRSRIPITRNRQSPRRMTRPRGFSSRKTSRFTVWPITATRIPSSGEVGGRAEPAAMWRSRMAK